MSWIMGEEGSTPSAYVPPCMGWLWGPPNFIPNGYSNLSPQVTCLIMNLTTQHKLVLRWRVSLLVD